MFLIVIFTGHHSFAERSCDSQFSAKYGGCDAGGGRGVIAMVAYIIGILPLIKNPKSGFPGVTQPWYTDDAGALGTFTNVELNFNLIKQFSLGRGYYPKPSKRDLIVCPDNLESVKRFVFCRGF